MYNEQQDYYSMKELDKETLDLIENFGKVIDAGQFKKRMESFILDYTEWLESANKVMSSDYKIGDFDFYLKVSSVMGSIRSLERKFFDINAILEYETSKFKI